MLCSVQCFYYFYPVYDCNAINIKFACWIDLYSLFLHITVALLKWCFICCKILILKTSSISILNYNRLFNYLHLYNYVA